MKVHPPSSAFVVLAILIVSCTVLGGCQDHYAQLADAPEIELAAQVAIPTETMEVHEPTKAISTSVPEPEENPTPVIAEVSDSPSEAPPYPAPGHDPVPVPRLHDIVERLPSEFVLSRTNAEACPRTSSTPDDRMLEFILSDSPNGQDLIAVASDLERSVAGWRLSDVMTEGLDQGDLVILGFRTVGTGSANPHVLVRATVDEKPLLWIVDCGSYGEGNLESAADGPRSIAPIEVLPAERDDIDQRISVQIEDWSGDGVPELLLNPDPRDPQSGSWALYANRGEGIWMPVMEIESKSTIADPDQDGRMELFDPLPERRWRVRSWSGDHVEEGFREEREFIPPTVDAAQLPALPVDLYGKRFDPSGDTVWRWPAAGGALEPVEASPIPNWTRLSESARGGDFKGDRSSDGRIEVRHERLDDPTDPIRHTAAPDDLPLDARPVGAIRLIRHGSQGIDSTEDELLVATYERDLVDREARRFSGLRMTGSGDRLAWVDGIGLWQLNVLEGLPRLLHQHDGTTFDVSSGSAGFQYPHSWSADGRYLLVEIAYFEGSDYAVWDMDIGMMTRIEGSISYPGSHSDVAWLSYSGQLLHARSGSAYSGLASLDLIDPLNVSSPKTLLEQQSGFYMNYGSSILGFAEQRDGSIVFGIRSTLLIDDTSNGFFRIGSDGSGLTRIADLPDARVEATADGSNGGHDCRMVFAPDASLFLCHNEGSSWPRYVVGNALTGEMWDVTSVFRSAEHGQTMDVAFVAP